MVGPAWAVGEAAPVVLGQLALAELFKLGGLLPGARLPNLSGGVQGVWSHFLITGPRQLFETF